MIKLKLSFISSLLFLSIFQTFFQFILCQPPIPGGIYPECLTTYQCSYDLGQNHRPNLRRVSVPCSECSIDPGWGTFCCVILDSCKQTGYRKLNRCPGTTFEVGGCANTEGNPCRNEPCCIVPLPA